MAPDTRSGELLQGTLAILILKALLATPTHGYGIARWIEQTTSDVLRVEEGSLYPALRRLERDKFTKGEWKVTDNGRRARYYRLTAAGKKRLEEITENWTALTRSVAKLMRFA